MVHKEVINTVAHWGKCSTNGFKCLFGFVNVELFTVGKYALIKDGQKFVWVVFVIFVCDFVNHKYILAHQRHFVNRYGLSCAVWWRW